MNKIDSFDRRLKSNNMLYRKGDNIFVHDYEELISTGLDEETAEIISKMHGKPLEIIAVSESDYFYFVKGYDTPLIDADIAGYVLQ